MCNHTIYMGCHKWLYLPGFSMRMWKSSTESPLSKVPPATKGHSWCHCCLLTVILHELRFLFASNVLCCLTFLSLFILFGGMWSASALGSKWPTVIQSIVLLSVPHLYLPPSSTLLIRKQKLTCIFSTASWFVILASTRNKFNVNASQPRVPFCERPYP